MRLFIPTLLLLCACTVLSAQKILQIERYGKPQSERFFIGDMLTYQLRGDDFFREGYIEDFRVSDSLIVFGDRYVKVDEIEMLRFPRQWSRVAGTSLMVFGGAWSGFALVGYATDKDPDTQYSTRDAVISGAAVATGFGLQKLFPFKKVRLGKRARLRLLDLRFKVEPYQD